MSSKSKALAKTESNYCNKASQGGLVRGQHSYGWLTPFVCPVRPLHSKDTMKRHGRFPYYILDIIKPLLLYVFSTYLGLMDFPCKPVSPKQTEEMAS